MGSGLTNGSGFNQLGCFFHPPISSSHTLENQTVETLKKMAFLERGLFQLQRFLVDFVVSSP